jgi:hypothetical protein
MAGLVNPVPSYPLAPLPGPFRLCSTACSRTNIAQAGEDAAVDTMGRVWFTEGGFEPTGDGGSPNHSRIVAFDPTDSSVRLYNIPGDHNSIIGIAWDGQRKRIWFAQSRSPIFSPPGGAVTPARLTSFDPERIPHGTDPVFDFSTTATCNASGGTPGTCSNASWHRCLTVDDCVVADQICAPGAPDADCYHDYPLHETVLQPARIAVHPDGSVWYADYSFGADIGRLDPETGAVTRFPLSPTPDGTAVGFPWAITIAPNNDVVVGDFLGGKIGEFKMTRLQDPSCQTLVSPDPQVDCSVIDAQHHRDPSCANPCIQDLPTPNSVFSVVYDRHHNLWFDQGYVKSGKLLPKNIVLFPPVLALFPSAIPCANGTKPGLLSGLGGGIVVDRVADEIWSADYCGRRVLRLRRAR